LSKTDSWLVGKGDTIEKSRLANVPEEKQTIWLWSIEAAKQLSGVHAQFFFN